MDLSAEIEDKNITQDDDSGDHDAKLFQLYLCCDGLPDEDVSCQEILVRDEQKPTVCDKFGSKLAEDRLQKDKRKICKEEKVSWDQVFNTKTQADFMSVSIDKKEIKRPEEAQSKQDKSNLTKIPDFFEEERSLTRPSKKEREELAFKGEENKVKKSQDPKSIYKCQHCCKSLVTLFSAERAVFFRARPAFSGLSERLHLPEIYFG